MEERLTLLETAVLTSGAHPDREGVCARELLHLIVTGTKDDATPPCLTSTLSVLPRLNDGPWRDDAHRTAVLLPWLRRLLDCPRDDERDRRRAFALADYAVRVIAAERLGGEYGALLAALPPITERQTVRFVGAAAYTAAAYAAAYAAYADDAAADAAAAEAAESAAAAASEAAEASAVLERHANALLRLIVETR